MTIPGITSALAESTEIMNTAAETAAAAHGKVGTLAFFEPIIEFLQHLVHTGAEFGIVIAEIIGISILVITAVKCFIKYFKKDEHIRLELAQGIALALEFKLGGEVLHTVTVSQDDWMALLFLGGIIALRGVLTLLLHWEIKIEEDRERLEMLDQQNDMMAVKLAQEKAAVKTELKEDRPSH